MHIIAELERPLAGLFEDMEAEDNDLGPEREPDPEEMVFRRLVQQLVPVGQSMPDDEDDGCPLCGNWTCTCADNFASTVAMPQSATEEDLNRDLDREYSDEELDDLLGGEDA